MLGLSPFGLHYRIMVSKTYRLLRLIWKAHFSAFSMGRYNLQAKPWMGVLPISVQELSDVRGRQLCKRLWSTTPASPGLVCGTDPKALHTPLINAEGCRDGWWGRRGLRFAAKGEKQPQYWGTNTLAWGQVASKDQLEPFTPMHPQELCGRASWKHHRELRPPPQLELQIHISHIQDEFSFCVAWNVKIFGVFLEK